MSAAVGGAHLTSTPVTSRPSVFEILSQEGFATALKPAIAHVVKALAERDPASKFGVAYRYFDELYLGFDAVIQWHYILTRGATLSEAFYGLERNVTATDRKQLRIQLSYWVSVLLPYVLDKLEKHSKEEIEETQLNSERRSHDIVNQEDFKQYISKILASVYPRLKLFCRAANLLCLLSYAFGHSVHPNLPFKLLKISFSYTSEDRSKFMQTKNAELFMLSEWKNIRNVPKLMLRSFGESVLWMVEIGTFVIQFLDWWYHDEKRARMSISSQPIPPAPHALSRQNVQGFLTLQKSDFNKCPLCRNDFKNPTAISVSGVVYCYGCIFPYLKQNKRCPLTNFPCNINHLIRVYR